MELRSPSFDKFKSNNITQQEIPKNQTEMPFIQAFLNDRPKLSFDTVQLRLRNAKTLNHEIGEYFKERVIIEDNYIKSIQRLANKTFVADRAYMGTFTSIWDTLFNELMETATLHSFYVTKISDEIETPLREMTIADPKWTQLKQEEPNLSKLAKEYEERVSKVNKFKTKKEKLSGKRAETSENKLIEAQKALEQIKDEWHSEWSKYLETMQAEAYQKRVEISEKNLSTIMEFNVQDEIVDFCSKAIEGNLSHIELNNSGNSLKNAFVTIGTMRRKRTPSHNSENLHPSKSENDSTRNGINILRNSSSHTSFTFSNENSFSSPVEISSPGEISYSPVEISSSPGEISSSPVEISIVPEKALRVEIKPTSTEINEADAAAAMSHVISTLKSTPAFKNRPPRGRRDRNTYYPDNNLSVDQPSPLNLQSSYRRSNISIIETINVMTKAGNVTKLLITGEIMAVIKYQVHIDPENKNSYLPLQIIPQWKCESNKTSLVIAYQINPECKLITTAETAADRKLSKLSDISFIIPVDGDVVYVQSKPTGIWSTEKNWMYWQLEDIDLTSTTTSTATTPITPTTPIIPTTTGAAAPETPSTPFTPMIPSPSNSTSSLDQKKIIARFGTNKTSQPAPAAVKFVCKGQLLSNISLEINVKLLVGNL
ncbi:8564_t:CDS:10 [Diversispora eburnea]|uniref:8564_t:CDS:1 n=1 Tax=Diversispora eburnea TaxID=1213867 RepID=A0A9N8VDN3_9GLOM|nr:8564_t:CDS:10 [Diversispora eburnea]